MNARQRAAYFEGRKKFRNTDDRSTQDIPRDIGAVSTPNDLNDQTDTESRLTSASAAFGKHSEHPSGARSLNDRRKQGAVASGTRRISSVNVHGNVRIPNDYNFRGRAEVDTRADTTCAGAAFALIETTGKECDVKGFHDEMMPIRNIPIATCATAYDHPQLQETIILLFHEALYFGKDMDHSLINPNQIRANGLTVDCCPRQYDKSSMYAIFSKEENISLPFKMHGCISYLPIRLPTAEELAKCRQLEMTSERCWEPYSDEFQDVERPFTVREDVIETIRESRNIYASTPVPKCLLHPEDTVLHIPCALRVTQETN